MKAMTAHIQSSGDALEIGTLMRDEIAANKREVTANPQWSESDRKAAFLAMDTESTRILSTASLYSHKDSVKGENAMAAAYRGYMAKAVDVITLHGSGELVLMEAKYLIRLGGRGPFGGPSSFKSRVSDKFSDVAGVMRADGERIKQLRIIVVTDEQLPFSTAHIHGLLNASPSYPPGSFSSDGNQYDYVLCSSSNLRTIIDGAAVNKQKLQDCLFFTL